MILSMIRHHQYGYFYSIREFFLDDENERRDSNQPVSAHVYGKYAAGRSGTDSGDRGICLVGEAGGNILFECVSWNLVRAVIANDRGDPCGGAGFRYFRQDEA